MSLVCILDKTTKNEKSVELIKSNDIVIFICDICFRKSQRQYRKTKYGLKPTCQECLTKQKWLNNYSVDNPFKYGPIIERVKKADRSEKVQQKKRLTCLKKYGVDNVNKLSSTRSKIDRTNLKKYGSKFPTQTDAIKNRTKQTCLKKYGVESHNQVESVKVTKQKVCLEKYGVDNVSQISAVKNKKYLTHKKNNSFNISKPERVAESALRAICSDLICQHKEDRYPFSCDFYSPTKDLFIECNFHWAHGKKPFDSNDMIDLAKLGYWQEKSKNSKFYKHAIKTWTVSDLEKRNIAAKNNLNYLVFWSLKDLLKYCEVK
jgi:hypothetical protein